MSEHNLPQSFLGVEWQKRWVERISRNLEGVFFFSVGTCPGCDECPSDPNDDGASFCHHSTCDSCGSTMGGDRHPAHGVIAKDEADAKDRSRMTRLGGIEHFTVCVDCVMFHANGDLPESEPR